MAKKKGCTPTQIPRGPNVKALTVRPTLVSDNKPFPKRDLSMFEKKNAAFKAWRTVCFRTHEERVLTSHAVSSAEGTHRPRARTRRRSLGVQHARRITNRFTTGLSDAVAGTIGLFSERTSEIIVKVRHKFDIQSVSCGENRNQNAAEFPCERVALQRGTPQKCKVNRRLT